jgi:hypothetical protein
VTGKCFFAIAPLSEGHFESGLAFSTRLARDGPRDVVVQACVLSVGSLIDANFDASDLKVLLASVRSFRTLGLEWATLERAIIALKVIVVLLHISESSAIAGQPFFRFSCW